MTDLRDQAPGEPKPDRSFYYVDEAGDPTLFDRKGRVIVGQPGCSRFFVLGKIDVADPDGLAAQLAELRRALLADPYFAGVPSMAPTQRKTARLLHAKDDLPEVRREVFKLLVNSDFRFYAVVRDKRVIAQKVLEHNQRKPAYRYKPNQLYDRCIPLLFQERLHKETAYRIVFARRGSSDRTDAFARGLQTARERLRQKRGIESSAPIEVVPSDPATVICLQAVDYCLWAVQRCFERGEHRYLNLLWDHVGLIVDRDDTAERPTGEYYHRRRPMRPNLRA